MSYDRSGEPESLEADFMMIREQDQQPASEQGNDRPQRRSYYRIGFGMEPIRLTPVECRILRFLATRPYHPFTRRRIADAVSTQGYPVTEASIDQRIASLREQLGFFHDYVQTVPHIGYRFKA